ncbi:radical SAM protein [Thermogladius sp. 4427co]|uniref:radical SAM protein n=1 Tax=Thermogladius sp. 4427co TaxID=3450718 RepID=UPI003F79CA6F
MRCLVCERKCIIPPGRTGACWNYENIDGRLYAIGYGKLSAIELRPIEIKPLFHYWPNSTALTYSSYGCNFYCPWCQNDHLSYAKPPRGGRVIPPGKLVELALLHGADGLSASFNEPATQVDYIIDATIEARKHGLYSMVVTNMYFTEKSLTALIEAGVDGFSADIKGCPGMKKALVGVDHELVFRNARRALEMGGHVEMIYLVVTNTNDYEECYKWIIGKHLDYLGPNVPLHVNRYYPAHRWREPPTPMSKLLEIRRYAIREGLSYVYIGNVGDPELESTYCPKCGKLLVRRSGYRVTYFNLVYENGRYKCPRCGTEIPIRGRYIP